MSPWSLQIHAITSQADDRNRIASMSNNGNRTTALAALETESKVLHTLRSFGPTDAKEIADRTELSETAVRTHLATLVEKNKVRIVRADRPRKFEAINQLPPH